LLALLAVLLLAQAACYGPAPAILDDVAVEVHTVILDVHHSPVVVLKEKAGSRHLPIWIGPGEARSISRAIDDQKAERPNSHDLTKTIIENLEGKVERVVVTELRGGTYYATLFLRNNGGATAVDSRPSDAIAIALRIGAPIFVRAQLFESAAKPLSRDDPGQAI
jgi:hypothetical protein